jgi:D-sedoheptulose 7-phosphate isomerase
MEEVMFETYRDDVIAALRAVHPPRVQELIGILSRAQAQNATVYILGNGGSAATASHFANDLVKMCGVRAVALTDLTPLVLAYGNDHGWDQMFALPLQKLLLPQDVVIGISCSGNSANVVNALRLAKEISLPAVKTAVLTGADVNCELARCVPHVIVFVPFRDIRVQEDVHLAICHAVTGALSHGHTLPR